MVHVYTCHYCKFILCQITFMYVHTDTRFDTPMLSWYMCCATSSAYLVSQEHVVEGSEEVVPVGGRPAHAAEVLLGELGVWWVLQDHLLPDGVKVQARHKGGLLQGAEVGHG